jgi:hypothetical protein
MHAHATDVYAAHVHIMHPRAVHARSLQSTFYVRINSDVIRVGLLQKCIAAGAAIDTIATCQLSIDTILDLCLFSVYIFS